MGEAQKMMESIYSRLDTFLKSETVIGEPMQVGEITLIPIITASFGMGGGIAEAKEKKGNDSEGGGGGLGCKITANAVLVVRDDNVELISLNNRGSLDKLFEMMPEMISKLEAMSKGKEESDEEKEEQQQEEKKEE